ncbi:MAG: Xylose isomerase-like TIM barrel [candidate division BRC1 bacterium ADurb.BinA364]|nr:MAG: Xylose isomerase-like TIM barrel [candidate division BRC1 bacterium ADurb.BinA364]
MQTVLGAFTRPWTMLPYPDAMWRLGRVFSAGGIMRCQGRLAIDLDSTEEEARAAADVARERGVALLCMLAQAPHVAQSAEAGAADFRRNVDLAAAAAIPHILATGIGDASKQAVYIEALRLAAPYAAERGTTIGLKPHGGITATGADCRRIAEAVGRRGFGLWFDPGNFIHYDGLDPVREAAPMAEYCVGVCLKDCRRDEAGKPNVNILPGTGEVDFEACLRTLAKADFDGPMLIECLGGAEPDEVDANARQAKEYFEAMLRAI